MNGAEPIGRISTKPTTTVASAIRCQNGWSPPRCRPGMQLLGEVHGEEAEQRTAASASA